MFGRKKIEADLTGPLTEDSIRQWLIGELSRRIETSSDQIDTTRPFEAYGLDSRVAVQVSGSLEKIVERRLSPGLLYEHPTIDDLSGYLATELRLADRA